MSDSRHEDGHRHPHQHAPKHPKLARFLDKLRNGWRGPNKPHWCSIHHCEYNAQVFKECPRCFSESGPFHHDEMDDQP